MRTTTRTTTVSTCGKLGSVLFSMGWVEGFEPSATGTTNHTLGYFRAIVLSLSSLECPVGQPRIRRVVPRTTTEPLQSWLTAVR
jgi:hypothetical protein